MLSSTRTARPTNLAPRWVELGAPHARPMALSARLALRALTLFCGACTPSPPCAGFMRSLSTDPDLLPAAFAASAAASAV